MQAAGSDLRGGNDGWTTVIQAGRRSSGFVWTELWPYRELVFLLFWRDFVTLYRQTVLGPLWFVLQPLMTTTVFTVIFGKIAKIPTDGIDPFVFYLPGVVMWSYFASCLTATSSTFLGHAGLFGKVYFPRLVVPVALLLTNFLSFVIQFSFFVLVYLVLYVRGAAFAPNAAIALLPLLLLQTAFLSLGTGLIIASLTTKYRDLVMVVGFGVSLWMYATPIVYPVSQIPVQWQSLFFLNPMTAVVETVRFAFFGAGSAPRPLYSALSVMFTLLILFVGVRMFHRAERTFLDTI